MRNSAPRTIHTATECWCISEKMQKCLDEKGNQKEERGGNGDEE